MRKGDAVRFKPGSRFRHEAGISTEQVGYVHRAYTVDGEPAFDVDFRPASYVFGAPVEDLEAAEVASPETTKTAPSLAARGGIALW